MSKTESKHQTETKKDEEQEAKKELARLESQWNSTPSQRMLFKVFLVLVFMARSCSVCLLVVVLFVCLSTVVYFSEFPDVCFVQ
jgi:hypothetical protein